MTRKHLSFLTATAVVVVCTALTVGIATATAGGGNSANAKLCQKNGWQTLVTATGDTFQSADECTSYAARGGVLHPLSSAPCLDGGWQAPAQQSDGTGFGSEADCTAYTAGNGRVFKPSLKAVPSTVREEENIAVIASGFHANSSGQWTITVLPSNTLSTLTAVTDANGGFTGSNVFTAGACALGDTGVEYTYVDGSGVHASAGATLDWELFLGMRHVIEEIPLQTNMAVIDTPIGSNPRLAVSVNVNNGIDTQLGGTYVSDTNAYWAQAQTARKRVGVTSRTTSVDVMRALADAATDDQILYFYCHAESAALGDPGGPDASALVLTDARITLADLNLDAPTTTMLRGQPLVFINACESAELSPAFYDGFVPYFMAKGARGVIGTQCKTPALFAVEWAKRFFERFLDGDPIGEAFLALRREFLDQHGNPLGLLYAVHCDGDTRIEPALV